MTARTWQAPGITAANGAAGVDVAADRSSTFSWDDWFRHASVAQRADALGLARQQGVIYPHQLPTGANGVKSTSPKDIETNPIVSRLLAGKGEALPRLYLDSLTYFDGELDELQRQAVARALATPDLFMLQGLPGTGKSRVLAEIVLQAAVRGWRVLLLAGHTASVDVVLRRLYGRSEVLALRLLDASEKPQSLPDWLRGLTLDAQHTAFVEKVGAEARGNQEQAEMACRRHHDDEPLWAELEACAARLGEIDQQLQSLQAEGDGIAAVVAREAEQACADLPYLQRLAERQRSHEEQLSALDKELQAHRDTRTRLEQEASALASQIAQKEPAYLAKKEGRVWTLSYWLHLFNGQIVAEVEALVDRHAQAVAGQQQIAAAIAQLDERRRQEMEQFAHDRAALLAGEVQSRRQALDTQRQTAVAAQRDREAQWQALCDRLEATPAAKTADAIEIARQFWQDNKRRNEQQCQFAQQWARYVQESGAQLAAKLPSFANVLAGSIQRWQSDAKFRESAGSSFDLLIVEDGESLTEADFLKLSRYASRWVLVGQALAEPAPAPTIAEKASRALLPAPLVSAACWTKLWQALGGEAGCWPCTWQREQGRLVCQLSPLSAEDRQHLESEGLADAPDIELRILHRPRTQPCLVQVLFAPHHSFADAFAFMMREVQEFPLEPLGRTGWWTENAECVRRHFGLKTEPIEAWFEIEVGVRLGQAGSATTIAAIEFTKSAGWDLAQAAEWLQRQRGVPDHERTVFLQKPYRYASSLASFVQAVVRVGDWMANGAVNANGKASFEFVAAPARDKSDWPREGAGLELDLTAPRHADRLPVGLRPSLPPRGFVNYLEAQALIRRLEAWSQQDANLASEVALLALYEGQVELLRRLVEQSEILRSRRFPLEVALPSRLHQRECDVVFLSLTRSHAHRCVAFGEDARELPLALTRARQRLFVFGDPGALSKRASWHGPLEQLDAQSAQQEWLRCSRLLRYLQSEAQG